jgi:hypothetical protein
VLYFRYGNPRGPGLTDCQLGVAAGEEPHLADLTRQPHVQPPLIGMDDVLGVEPARQAAATAEDATADAPERRHLARPRGRRRYWSIRDLSRRLWFGRGYDLLRELIRTGILPATRSARSWWVEDADVAGLLAAFEAGAGKVRAFRRLKEWLAARSWVVELPETTAVTAAALPDERIALRWRGALYLPRSSWQAERLPHGGLVYRHPSGVTWHAPESAETLQTPAALETPETPETPAAAPAAVPVTPAAEAPSAVPQVTAASQEQATAVRAA